MKTYLLSFPFRFFVVLGLVFLFISAINSQRAAQAAPGDIEVTILAAPNLVVDSNVLSPSTQAPEVATVLGRFCNTSGSTIQNVVGYIGDYDTTTPANSTPGIYPPKTNVTIGGTTYTGTYRFTHLGGTNDAVRIIGSLAPGACSYQYWSFSYPKTANGGTIPAWGNSVQPTDDLSLDFDVWAAEGSVICNSASCNKTHKATMRNEISAMANKIEPNGNPGGQWFNTNSQTVQVGETITTNGILYRLGNINQGFDNNGDLVPDYNAWLQPIGNPTYDPSCFRLIETSGVLTVTRSGGNPNLIIPFSHSLNQANNAPLLYFTDLPTNNTNVQGLVYYTFMALGGPCTIPISPYQEVASGSDNEKFNGDYGGGGPGTIETFAPNIAFDKNGPVSTSVGGGNFTYTISYQNNGSTSMGLALSTGLSAGFVVSDTVPVGLNYVAGSAGGSPPGGNSYVIYYSTNGGLTWSTTDPGTVQSTSSAKVMMQWWLTLPLSAGASGTATWQAAAPGNYFAAGGAAFVENCADARLGTGASFAEDCTITMVQGNNSIGDTVWSDNGVGGGVRNNGIQDGSEAGIPNITVTLYWDKNGDGILDSGDIVVGEALTNISGSYSFSNLPDGNYIVIADTVDPDLPVGYGPSTPYSRAVALDPARTNPSPVIVLTADFGFGPSLSLTKNVTSLTPVYVGENVTFTITLYNNLPGDGTAQGFCKYVLWATVQPPADGTPLSYPTGDNRAWQNIPTGILGQPDGNFVFTVLSNNPDTMGLSGFNISGQTGTITSVQLLAYAREFKDMQASDQLQLIVFRNNAADATNTFTYNGTTFFNGPAGTDYLINQTLAAPVGGWQWNQFQNNLTELQAIGNGTGGNRGDIGLDAVAFVITSNQQCGSAATTITELPLTDTYDPAYLQFVSSNPPPTSQTPGTITWNNVGPLYAGGSTSITLTFKALATVASTANTGTSTNGKFGTGRPVNDASGAATVAITASGSIAGVIWAESDATNQWTNPTGYDGADSRIPGVTVQLYGCFAILNGVSQLLTPGTAGATNMACTATQNNGNWVVISTQQTAADGSYQFNGLRPGYYNVKILESTLPPGLTTRTGDPNPAGNGAGIACGTCDGQWNTDTANLNSFNDIISGENIIAVSFGYRDPDGQGAITGYAWNDRNADGTWDANEEPIPNVSVYLCTTTPCNSSTPGAVLAATDSNGRYTYGNLNAGAYYVGVTTPSGMSQSGDPDVPGVNCGGSCDNQTNAITLAARQVRGPYNFGYTGGLTIGDTIYADWNGNGSQDSGEEGLNGVQVLLYRDLNGNGIVDSGDTLLSTQTTNSSGFYQFTNLAGNGNQYLVRVATSSLQAGYSQTADPDEPGTCILCNNQQVVTLIATSVATADFGYQPRGYGSIGDYVWNDLDGDGNQDSTESGINGVVLNLYQDQNGDGLIDPATDALVATTTTSAGGLYTFSNLIAGNYIVEIAQSNFNAGQPLAGLTLTSSGAAYTSTGSQVSYRVTLLSGQAFTNADFGFAQGLIGDFIWRDDDGDGEPDTGEPGISGVTVTLYNDNNGNGILDGGDTFRASTPTNSSGYYEFGSLPAGDYVVVVTPPVNHTLTGDPDAYGITSSLAPPCDPLSANYFFCDNQYGVSLLGGQTNRTADFGYKPQGVIGDTLWIDGNHDGVRNPGESGIPYITIRLCSALPCTGGNLLASTTTDSSGNYSFGGLGNGTYFVQVDTSDPDLPPGLTQTYDPDGTLDHTANSIVITGGVVTSIGGNACTNCELNIDFGYRYAGTNTVTGTIWHDDDNGGQTGGIGDIDSTETFRYSGVTVYLWQCGTGACNDGDEVLAGTTTTGANGEYTFSDVANGTFAVTINPNMSPLAGIASTTPTGYTGSSGTNPAATLTGGTTATRDFGFLSTLDYGDLPSSYTNTLAAVNGARHHIGTVRLGTTVDSDPDGQESSTAAGDTDDGVFRSGTWTDGPNGAAVTVLATCPSPPCYLTAWMDWNNDGDFNDPGERIFLDQIVVDGTNALTFNVPTGTFPGSGSNLTFNARFRLYAASTGGLAQPTGFAVNGEVEDYQWVFAPTAITLQNLNARTNSPLTMVWVTVSFLLLLGGAGLFLRSQSLLETKVPNKDKRR